MDDTKTTKAELARVFGPRIARIVAEVSDDKWLRKEARKQLQVEHARHISRGARLVKLPDKICDASDLAKTPPVGWALERKREYCGWVKAVVAGLRGENARGVCPMRWPTMCFSLLVMLARASGLLAAVPEDGEKCTLQKYASLNVTWSDPTARSSLPLVSVFINDVPATMVFDSAAFISILSESAAKRMNLPIKPLPVPIEEGNTSLRSYVTVPRMKIGNLVVKNFEMALHPTPNNPKEPPANETVVGRLGLTGLTGIDVELDLGHDKINLFSADRCAGSPAYWTDVVAVAPMHRGHLRDPYFDMELDGKKVQTKIYSAAAISEISPSVSKALYGFDEKSPDLETAVFGNGMSYRHFRAMTLTGSGLLITNADIIVEEDTGCTKGADLTKDRDGATGFVGCYGAYPLRLGVGVLKKLRLFTASKQEKLYFTRWDAQRPTAQASDEPSPQGPQ